MIKENLPDISIINYYDKLTFIRNLLFINNTNELRLLITEDDFFYRKGWRLTKQGKNFLINNFKHYNIKIENHNYITGKIVLNMDQCCNGPWYFYGNNLTVFNEIINFELQMVNCDLNAFIDLKIIKPDQ
jgi:hypothetical protein